MKRDNRRHKPQYPKATRMAKSDVQKGKPDTTDAKSDSTKKLRIRNIGLILLWVSSVVCTLLIVALLVLPDILSPKVVKTGNESDKLKSTMSMLQKQTNPNLDYEWFHYAKSDEFKVESPLYVDVERKAFVYKGDSVFYAKGADNNNIKIPQDANDRAEVFLQKFELDESDNVKDICLKIKADSSYLDRIITNNTPRNDQVFSLLYNTLLGDTVGHLYVTIKDGCIKIVRAEKIDKLNLAELYKAVEEIEKEPITPGCTVKELLLEKGAIEADVSIPFASLDYRNDCIRVAGGEIISKERYKDLSKVMLDNPTTLYVYSNERDTLLAFNDSVLCNAKYQLGKVDYFKLQSAKVAQRNDYRDLLPIFLLILGLADGTLLFALFEKYRKGASRNRLPAGEPYIPVETESETEINKIIEIINNNHNMENEDRKKLIDLLNQLLRESGTFEEVKNEREEYYRKYSNLFNVLSGKFTIKELLIAIAKDWGTVDGLQGKLIDAIQEQKKKAVSEFKNSEEYLNQKAKSDKYDALLDCHSENSLIEKLDKMRQESGGRMAAITTFDTIKGPGTTVKDVVELYDKQTKGKLMEEYDKMEGRCDWYNKRFSTVVEPVASLKNQMPRYLDRKSFIIGAIKTLVIPAMGIDNKSKIENYLKEYQTIENKAEAYRLLLESGKDFNHGELKRKLSSVINEDEASWIGDLREAARRYTAINKFNDSMWDNFVKKFVEKEKNIEDDVDKGWYFARIMEIAYHTADHIRCVKDVGNASYCHNAKLMENQLDLTKGTKEFSAENPMKNTRHSKKIYEWASELGVEHLKIVVDNYAIMP